jgi:hypothetical protein
VNQRIMMVLTPIQLAAMAIRIRSQARRNPRSGRAAFSNAANINGGTCTTVFVASSSMPNAIRNQLIHLELATARTSRRAQHTCMQPRHVS